jgi:hypothetical protein
MAYVRYLYADYHPPAPELHPSALKPPPFLFHWTNQEKLEAMDEFNPDRSKLPLRYLKANHYVATEHPELIGKPGLYAWTNPVNGMGVNEDETYALAKGGAPPRLLVIKPKAGATVIEVTTHVDNLSPVATPNLDKYDFVLNRSYDSAGKLKYSEWIVLNPDAVESYSADPHVGGEFLKKELARLEDPTFQYPAGELFYQQEQPKDFWIKTVKGYLKANSAKEIPKALKEPKNGESCAVSFAKLAS